MSGFDYLAVIIGFLLGNIPWYLKTKYDKRNLKINTLNSFKNDIQIKLDILYKLKNLVQTIWNGTALIEIRPIPFNDRVLNTNQLNLCLLDNTISQNLSEFYDILKQVNEGFNRLNEPYDDYRQSSNQGEELLKKQKDRVELLLQVIDNAIRKGNKAFEYLRNNF